MDVVAALAPGQALLAAVGDGGNGAGAAAAALVRSDYVDPAGVERMAAELEAQEKRRRNFSRRRTVKDTGADGGAGLYVDEANRRYNQRISKDLDPYSVEIRKALERGTA